MEAPSRKRFVLTAVLTSSKVAVLALIKGYCYKKIPQRSIPPTLSVLVDLIENDPTKRTAIGKQSHQEAIPDVVQAYFPSLSEIIESIKISVRSFFAKSNQENHHFVEQDIEHITKLILDEIWSIRSYDDFYTFVASSSVLLKDNNFESSNAMHITGNLEKPSKLLYSSSFLGNFVSTLALGATTMSFEEGIEVWKGFAQYREETKVFWMKLNGIDSIFKEKTEQELFEEQLLSNLNLTEGKDENLVYSQMDLANLFQSQVRSLERNATPMGSSMKEILQNLSNSSKSLLPSSYQVEHLFNWRNGDYDLSFDTLHRYFDYTMSNRKQYFYHYALLALAGVHDSYGASKEALRAIGEAITVARENKDMDCLNLLLTWLMNFMINKPLLFDNNKSYPSRAEILSFLRSKTKETNNLSLQAIAFQYDVLTALLEGPDLRDVIANLTKSLYLILSFSDSTDLKCVLVTACQIADTVFERIGYSAIGEIYMNMAIEYATGLNNEFDLVTLYIRKSRNAFFKGHVLDSLKILMQVKKSAQMNFSVAAKWEMAHQMMKCYLCLNECRYDECDILLSNLRTIINNLGDQEALHELSYLEAKYYIAIGASGKAFEILDIAKKKMIDTKLYFNQHWNIIYCRAQAEILISIKGRLRVAVSILLRNISIDINHSLVLNLTEDVILLCKGILKLKEGNYISDVDRIMDEFLPQILQIGKVGEIGNAYLVLSEVEICKYNCCYYQNAPISDLVKKKSNELHGTDSFDMDTQKETYIQNVQRYTLLAFEQFKKMHDFAKMKHALAILDGFFAKAKTPYLRDELNKKYAELSDLTNSTELFVNVFD